LPTSSTMTPADRCACSGALTVSTADVNTHIAHPIAMLSPTSDRRRRRTG
jgi:hypothetical protein